MTHCCPDNLANVPHANKVAPYSTGPARLLQSLLPIVTALAVEVDAFFLKHALWLPSGHPLVIAHTMLTGLLAVPAFREYYDLLEVRL